MDTVIQLKRPADYKPEEGMLAELRFEKGRNYFPDDPLIALTVQALDSAGNKLIWTYATLEATHYDQICDLYNTGMTPSEIREDLGLDRTTVYRHLRQARQDGDLDRAAEARFDASKRKRNGSR